MLDAKKFGEVLKGLREQAGLTQIQLAEKSKIPIGTIRDYEQNRREPLLSTAARLAGALGVDCTAFTQEPDEREPAGPGRPRKVSSEADQNETEKPKKARKKKDG
jgi:transcriptional regulator with XRE-family HTH domain